MLSLPTSFSSMSRHTSFLTPATTGTEWLNERDLYDCARVIHDTQYPQAKLQPVANSHHMPVTVMQLETLLTRGPLVDNHIGIDHILHNTVHYAGAAPMITFGDSTHYRVIGIDSMHKTVTLADPLGKGFTPAIKAALKDFFVRYDSDHTWRHVDLQFRLQTDAYSCGIWALYFGEKWLEYHCKTQLEAFPEWVQPHLRSTRQGVATALLFRHAVCTVP